MAAAGTLFSLDTHDRVMREYAAAAQVTVVGLDYTLVRRRFFRASSDEVTASLRLLRQPGTAEALGFDCSALPLAVAGDSAGGNLAMAAALALRDGGAADSLAGRHPELRGGWYRWLRRLLPAL